MSSETSTPERGTLIGYGRTTWSDAHARLADATCLWADHTGYHLGQAPEHAPLASHLWAWWPARDSVARVRLDEDDAYLAVLIPESTVSEPTGHATTSVTIRRHAGALPWNQRNVGPLPADLTSQTFEILELTGAHPTTFIQGRPAAPADR